MAHEDPTMVKKKPPLGDGAPITPFCRTNLEIQGNLGFSDEDLLRHRPGFRFAYQMCFAVTLLGTVRSSGAGPRWPV